jgi:hypothetical protein
MYVSLGNEDIEFNGIMSRVESIELIETTNILRMEVLSFKTDNERIIIPQQEINNVNTHLLKSLNELKRK